MLVALLFYIMLNVAYFVITNGIKIDSREKDEAETSLALFDEYALKYKATLR